MNEATYLKIERFAIFHLNCGPQELLDLITEFVGEWETEIKNSFICMDCNMDTSTSDYDYYTINDDLWLTANPKDKGMLCLSCLSDRLGRALAWEDFDSEAPINWKIKDLYESTKEADKALPYLRYG